MQSLARQLRRGNAHIMFSSVTKQNEIVVKHGTTNTKWKFAELNALKETEKQYIDSMLTVTNPERKSKMENTKRRYLANKANKRYGLYVR